MDYIFHIENSSIVNFNSYEDIFDMRQAIQSTLKKTSIFS